MIEENYEYFGEFDDTRDAAAFQFRSNDSSSYYDDRKWNGSFRWNGSRRHSWPEESRLHNLTVALNTYALPVIILMGIVGNSVSLLVYVWTPRLCRQSSSVYLAFLSAVDNVSLVFVFTIWFNWIDIPIFHKNGWCHTVQFCTYVCSFLSAWTVVSFTCERWIVVFRPLRRHRMCTRRRAVVVMTSLTVGSMVFYSFSFVTTQVQYVNDNPVCTDIADYILAQNVVRSIDTTLTVIIPVIAIVFMNVGIGLKICRYTSNRNQESNPGTPSAGEEAFTSNISSQHRCSFEPRSRQAVSILQTGGVSSSVARGGAAGGSAIIPRTAPAAVAGNNKNLRLCTRRQHTQLRITRALFIVSSLFVVLNLPSYVFRVHALVISLRRETHLDYMGYIWQEFLQFIYYINFSSRFFLYLSCSRHFRYAINRFVCKFKKR